MSPRVHGWSDALTFDIDNLWWVLVAIVLTTLAAFVVSALLVRMLIVFGARARLLDTVVENVKAFVEGQPRNVVNP